MSNTIQLAVGDARANATDMPKPGETFRDQMSAGTEGPLLVVVPAGEFIMGAPESESGSFEDERPLHPVSIEQPFAMGVYPVTFGEFDLFARETRREAPADEGWGRLNRPVINVSFNDAEQYCAWLSRKTGRKYRLPSEAEWEYAARGGTSAAYWWGETAGEGCTVCETCGSDWDDEMTSPVGSFDANPMGLCDVHGNIWEWTQDHWFPDHSNAPETGDARVKDNSEYPRVIKGGSWLNNPISVRAAVRSEFHPLQRVNIIGFRVCTSI